MIELNNLTDIPVDEKLLNRLGKYILGQEGIQEKVGVSVAMVEEDEIQRLNRIYRGKNEPTDVLSFREELKSVAPPSQIKQLGEIVICPSQIKEREGDELWQVFIHGLLHLLGYDHQSKKDLEIMEAKQKEYLTSFFKKHGSA